MSKCPILSSEADKYKLSDKQIEQFCNKGCSVECGKFLEEYVARIKKECE